VSNDGPGMFDPMTMMRLWSEGVLRMMQAAAGATPWTPWGAPAPASPPSDVPRQFRAAMLDAWTQWWDRFLRSPEFMETMKGSLDASTQWRKQLNEWLGNVHHEFQGASRQDLDEVIRSLRHVEERLADAIQAAVRTLAAQCEDTAAEVRRLRAAVDGRDRPEALDPGQPSRGEPEVPRSRRAAAEERPDVQRSRRAPRGNHR